MSDPDVQRLIQKRDHETLVCQRCGRRDVPEGYLVVDGEDPLQPSRVTCNQCVDEKEIQGDFSPYAPPPREGFYWVYSERLANLPQLVKVTPDGVFFIGSSTAVPMRDLVDWDARWKGPLRRPSPESF